MEVGGALVIIVTMRSEFWKFEIIDIPGWLGKGGVLALLSSLVSVQKI